MFRVAAVALVQPHDIHAARERFGRDTTHVVRVARPIQAVQHQDGRSPPGLRLPVAGRDDARVVIDVEVAAHRRRESGEVPGIAPAEERHPVTARQRGTRDEFQETPDPELPFVSRWSVDGRHGHVVEPQIDAELSAMMHDVIDHEAPESGHTRHREHLVAVALERPAAPCIPRRSCAFWRASPSWHCRTPRESRRGSPMRPGSAERSPDRTTDRRGSCRPNAAGWPGECPGRQATSISRAVSTRAARRESARAAFSSCPSRDRIRPARRP